MHCLTRLSLVAVLLALTFPLTPHAQEVVRTGPPTAIRALLESVMTAVNSADPNVWEQFALDRFAPELLKQRSREERAQIFANLRRDLGTITLDRVTREGPDEPLQLKVTGSTGATAIIGLTLALGCPSGSAQDSATSDRRADREVTPRTDGV